MQGIKSCPWLALSSLIQPEKYKYKYKGLQLWRRRSLSHLYWENTAWGIWLEILLIIYFISNCVGSQIPKLIVDFLKKKNFHTDQAWRLKRSHCAPRWQCYKNGPSIKIAKIILTSIIIKTSWLTITNRWSCDQRMDSEYLWHQEASHRYICPKYNIKLWCTTPK